MSTIHLPLQRPAPGPASADAAPAGDPAWTRVLLVAGSRAALAAVLSLVVWSVLPAALGWSPRVIMSGSMMPRISVGDVVVDRPVDPSDLTEGRIITVTDPDHPEKTRTHRFLRLDEDGNLVTQGDANDAPDSTPVDPDDVLGLAALRVPYVGLPVTWMAQGQLAPVGIAVTVLLLLGLAATAPLRLGAEDEDDADDDAPDDADDTDDAGPDDRDLGLGILDPAAAADRRDGLRRRVPRRGGRVVTRSARALAARRPRLAGLGAAAVGALLAMSLTTQTTYAALSATTSNPASSFAAAASFDTTAYFDAVRADNPLLYWRMDEASGAAVADSSGASDVGTLRGTYQRGRAGAITTQGSSPAVGLTTATLVEDKETTSIAARFSVEAWVRTSSRTGGLVVGLGNEAGAGGPGLVVDRALFLSSDGRLRLGVDGKVAASSSAAINDGQWHHVVGVLDGNGNLDAALYVDGVAQAGAGKSKVALTRGYWRVGGGRLAFTGATAAANLDGDVDEVAVYGTALPQTRVQAHRNAALGLS